MQVEQQFTKGQHQQPRQRRKQRIGITLGDPNGIGTELLIMAFNDSPLRELCTPVVYGSSKVLNHYRKLLSVEKFSYNIIQDAEQAQPRKVNLIESMKGFEKVEPGTPSTAAGSAAVEALRDAVGELKAGHLDALVTLPIDKSTTSNAAFPFPGHTEYLAQEFGVQDNLMFMVGEKMKVAVATGHIPVNQIAQQLTTDLIFRKIMLLNKSLKQDFTIQKPKIAVLGLNPHAGDNGLLGKEEQEVILPAVKMAAEEKVFVMGPFAADGFFASGKYLLFDAVLAMYHDQGLIPFKQHAGFAGVNFTAAMPVIRTSPDHGTAYDIAGRGIASLDSFLQALYLAIDVHRNRTENEQLKAGSLNIDQYRSLVRNREDS